MHIVFSSSIFITNYKSRNFT